jgi:alpha-amylase
VVVGLDLAIGTKELSVGSIFKDGTKVRDAYSGKEAIVSNGKISIDSEFDIVLLELKK